MDQILKYSYLNMLIFFKKVQILKITKKEKRNYEFCLNKNYLKLEQKEKEKKKLKGDEMNGNTSRC